MIVITGATGNVGRTLVRLVAASGQAVTAVSRGIEPDSMEGVRAVAADLADPASLRPALEGADTLFLLVAGEDPDGIVAEARAAGVRRIVLLSSQGAGTRPASYAHAVAFENAVTGSGLDWTILRSGGLASNAYAWVQPIKTARVAPAPYGDVGLPFIDPDDVAATAAAVLTSDGHKGQFYVLTGPALTTPRERAAAIEAALGEPVRFVEQTRDEAYAEMTQFMPAPVAEGTLAILGTPTAEEQQISPDVERILGRPGTPFAEWARRNAPAFR
ncbi:MAG: NAD(P)H-binding protein [Hamadaea sp.]|nr:NAD(P)H-binding protein [Hamadaea sp.]